MIAFAATLGMAACADDTTENAAGNDVVAAGDVGGGGDVAVTLGSIEGTVVNAADGVAIVGATIVTDPVTATATSGADGAYSLADIAPGMYAITVTADGFDPKTRDGVEVTAGAAVTVEFAMAAATVEPTLGGIVGMVKDEAGAAVVGAMVVTVPATVSAVSGADGTYKLADLEPATYAVNVTASGYLAGSVADVVVAAGADTTADVTLVAEAVLGTARVDVLGLCKNDALVGALVKNGEDSFTTTADGSVVLGDLDPGEYTFTVEAAGFLPSTATVTVTAGEEATVDVSLECQSAAVAKVASDFLATVGPDFSVVTPAQAVFDNMNDGNAENDFVVVSVRSAEHYAIGHVPGAINIPWKTVGSDDSLALLGEPIAGAVYLVYCYTGHTGGIATALLNMLGYKATNMKFGIMSWTKDAAVRAIAPFSEDTDAHDFLVETTINEATGDYDPPVMNFEGVTTPWEATRAAVLAYLAREGMAPTITAQAVFDLINDGDANNDPFILSVRKADHYAIGHVPGAVNIVYTDVAKPENLRKLPTDRKIVVYCYTGHTGAVATAVLGTLGYDTVNLKFGIDSWTKDAAVRVVAPYVEEVEAHEFPFNTGVNP